MARRLAPLLVLLVVAACVEASESDRPAARFEPEHLDLGRVAWAEGLPADRRLELVNSGDVPLHLESLDAGEGWQVAPVEELLDVRLEPGARMEVAVDLVAQPEADALIETDVTARLASPVGQFDSVVIVSARVTLEADCDADGDGHLASACGGADCDDLDPDRSPATPELCNGLVDGCGGLAPDELDLDGDGFFACAECDDTDDGVHPGADEACDGLDTDCDPSTEAQGGEQDGDGDGSLACEDCDDGTASIHPGAPELCNGLDDDCDGLLPDEADADSDGFPACAECDDSSAAVHPGAWELCNGEDDNCDGIVPPGEADADSDGFLACAECDDGVASTFPGAPELCNGVDDDCAGGVPADEVDSDSDGFLACADCDDGIPSTFPGAPELCNGLDDDCDGAVPADEVDGDSDGSLACADCDDGVATTWPGAPELCNGLDDDCDGAILADEVDSDLDGFLACAECDDLAAWRFPGAPELCNGADDDCDGGLPADEVDSDSDGFLACAECDDGVASTFPGAPELCNGVDDDCDGLVPADELDGDSDGFRACLDCDDADPAVHPAALEVCDGIDNDCDPSTDEWVDGDGDGFDVCAGDCDDGNADVWPGRPEDCDGLDNDCDGDLDEGLLWVPEDHASIQAALDARGPGDVVCVAAGEYEEELVVVGGPEAVIVGRSGSQLTSIVGADSQSGPLVEASSTGLELRGITLREAGLALDVWHVELGLFDVEVSDIDVPVPETALLVRHSDAVLEGVVLTGIVSSGAVARFLGGALDLSGLAVTSCAAGSDPLLVISGFGPASIQDFVFEDNQGGAIELSGSGRLVSIGDGTIVGGRTGVAVSRSTVTVENVVVADVGGESLSFGNSASATLDNVRVVGGCGVPTSSCPCSAIAVSISSAVEVHNTLVLGSQELGIRAGGELSMTGTSIVGSNYAGVRLYAGVHALVDSDISGNGLGLSVSSSLPPTSLVITHTNIGVNTCALCGPAPFTPGLDGNLSVDPQYLDISSPDPLDWDLHLAPTSPLVDAGDPSSTDPDGSPTDIGAFGGPGADLWDLDGDGWPSWWQPGPYDSAAYPALGLDCDDLDPEVGPDDC